MFVPPVSLIGSVGGSSVPKRRWATTCGTCTPGTVVLAAAASDDVTTMCVCVPLPLGGISMPLKLSCIGIFLLHDVVLMLFSNRAVDVLVLVDLAIVCN